jgi:hypothetical protein
VGFKMKEVKPSKWGPVLARYVEQMIEKSPHLLPAGSAKMIVQLPSSLSLDRPHHVRHFEAVL